MKKTISIVLTVALLLTLCSCATSSTSTDTNTDTDAVITENTPTDTGPSTEEFLDKIQGIWALKNDNANSCSIVEICSNQICFGTYPGSYGSEGTIRNISKSNDDFNVLVFYPSTVYFEGDPPTPESEVNLKMSTIDNFETLSITSDTGFFTYSYVGSSNSNWTEKCDTLLSSTTKENITVDDSTLCSNHSFTNGECSKCGAQRSDLSANIWYYLKSNDVVQFQNAKIYRAVPMSNGSVYSIAYYPVCRECHICGNLTMSGISVEKPVTKTYHCDNCNTITYVKFKLEY